MDTERFLLQAVPSIDKFLLEYTLSYFSDVTNDLSSDSIREFIEPLLVEYELSSEDMVKLCQKLQVEDKSGSLKNNCKVMEIPTPLLCVADDTTAPDNPFDEQKQKVDIRHGQTRIRSVNTTVDSRKLRKAELKIEAKRQARGAMDLYEGQPVPVWNPLKKPDIVVNQGKQVLNDGGNDIKLENFDIHFAGNKILTNANLTLAFGRRYGLVGKNGIGKSTLLRAIAHKELRVPSHLRILHVEQEAVSDDTPAILSVLKADEEREGLIKQEAEINAQLNKVNLSLEEAAKLGEQLKHVYSKLEDIESDKAESRASAILSGLGFSAEQQNQATNKFSGGWRMRLSLARALFCRPDLLLADEVTNYLDFPAVVWLESYFTKSWNATLLVVSHDRAFLDTVATDILHLHGGQLDAYRGGFHYFVETRKERQRNIQREYESQLQYRQHLQAFIDRWRYNAKRAPQAQSKIKILEKLPPLVPPSDEDMKGLGTGDSVYFKFPQPEKLSPPILQMDTVTFAYENGGRTILRNVSIDIQMDSKIAVVGPNGAGKSTLVYLLTGQTSPVTGIVNRHGRLRLALFSQHHVDQVEDLSLSPVQFLAKKFPGNVEEAYRSTLAQFGLSGITAIQPIGTLSGGQKSRVVFACMALLNPHVLVLDEPTNHLDMDSIDALAEALRAFQGGILIVSHDERFLDSVCNTVVVCQDGMVKEFKGKDGCVVGLVKQYKDSLLLSLG